MLVVGVLVGANENTITASSASGSVVARSRVIGGLTGVNRGTISDSHASSDATGSDMVGGLAGVNRGTVSTSSATGSVTGHVAAGGLIGWNERDLTGSYATGSVAGDENDLGGLEAKTTAELQSPAGYRGIYETWAAAGDFWDFGSSSDYPRLKADMDGDGVATAEEMAPRG